ncbi:MAG: exopolysaccharide biosynthesis polyprenyl glycosylphosphotransferase [Alphaproteobacteria bacterium]
MDRVETNHFVTPFRRPLLKSRFPASGLFFLALFFDVCGLFLAYKISFPLASLVIEALHTSSLESFYQSSQKHFSICFALSVSVLISFFFKGHYTERLPWWSQIQFILKSMLFALLVEGFSAYILSLYYSRILIVTCWVMAFCFLVLSRAFLFKIKSRVASWRLPTVIIGDTEMVTDTLFAIDSDLGMGLIPRGIFLRNQDSEFLDREELPMRFRNIRVLDGFAGHKEFIEAHTEYYYMISAESLCREERDSLFNLLTEKKIKFAIIPSIARTGLYQSKPLYFFGNDVVMLGTKDYSVISYQKFLKRIMDIVGAFVGLAVFGIPMLVVAALLKIEGQGGTVFYGGERIGKGGQKFCCWKFRSMEPGTDHLLHKYLEENQQAKAYWDRYFKLPDDPRVQTRTAKFIRKASIDELPQLWNVLKGEMSLVGPRPILPNEISAYGDNYREYTSLKPGLTGLWQVSGRNGTSFQRRVVWDSWYVRNWSLWGDIVIILKTIYVVLNRSGAN